MIEERPREVRQITRNSETLYTAQPAAPRLCIQMTLSAGHVNSALALVDWKLKTARGDGSLAAKLAASQIGREEGEFVTRWVKL